jgi:hypothetical protein
MALTTCKCGCKQPVSVNRRFCKRTRDKIPKEKLDALRRLMGVSRQNRRTMDGAQLMGLCDEVEKMTAKLLRVYGGFPHGLVV